MAKDNTDNGVINVRITRKTWRQLMVLKAETAAPDFDLVISAVLNAAKAKKK